MYCTLCGEDWRQIIKRCKEGKTPTKEPDPSEMHGVETVPEVEKSEMHSEETIPDVQTGPTTDGLEGDADEDDLRDWGQEEDMCCDDPRDTEFRNITRCKRCAERLKVKLERDCDTCGPAWYKEDYELVLIGNDVVALFPSLTSKRSGELVREEVEESDIVVEGFNHRLGVRYIKMMKHLTGDLKPLGSVMPWRKTVPGRKPTVASKEFTRSDDDLGDDKWCHPKREPTQRQKRQIEARVVEIATRLIFEKFTYKFGGVTYQQNSGGPIGARVTMCVARLVMQAWSRRYYNILKASGLRVLFRGGYVDDGGPTTTVLRKGMVFNR